MFVPVVNEKFFYSSSNKGAPIRRAYRVCIVLPERIWLRDHFKNTIKFGAETIQIFNFLCEFQICGQI